MEERLSTPFVLSLLGGLFVLAGTIMGFVYLPSYGSYPYGYVAPYNVPFLVTSGVAGILILLGAYFLYLRPELHVAWGVMILVLSVASTFAVVTGYYALFGSIGIIFGLIGGSMAVGWRAGGLAPRGPGLARVCYACGRYVPMGFPYCGYCGSPATAVRPPSAMPPSMPPGAPPQP